MQSAAGRSRPVGPRTFPSVSRRRLALLSALTLVVGTLSSSLPVSAGPARPVRGQVDPALHAARDALVRNAGTLGIDPARFGFETVRRSLVGTHVRGREMRGGVPVEGTSAAVHFVRGDVWRVEARPSPLPGAPVHSPVSAVAAVRSALAFTAVTSPYVPPAAERRLVARAGRLVDAYVVSVASVTPPFIGAVVVSATDGSVLEVRDERRHYEGTASLFDPNPVVTLRNKGLRTPGIDEGGVDTDLDSPALDAALVRLPIRDYRPSELVFGRLVGPWVDVRGPAPLEGPDFHYTRSSLQFEAVMSYAHLDRAQRFIRSLGFRGEAGVNAEPQLVIAFPVVGFDNSFYDPQNDLMLFGAGGVDDGEDAEVILHEYGHAIHDAQVPGWGEHHEGGSMGEGWGDFLAGAYYAARISRGFQDECIADWDATSYSDQDPPCLRRLDEEKRYPEDMENEVHADGEIWSAYLWRLRDLLSCRTAPRGCGRVRSSAAMLQSRRVLQLVLTSHEFMSTTATFNDGVAALRLAARALHHPEWLPLIVRAARERGLPVGLQASPA